LFETSSVLVTPYDSATGSSGPAHQACEYGLPIVSADLPDFRAMADDEDMAISFYKTGDAPELADRISQILASPPLQRSMGQHNFAAALRMTMPNVVRHYLRWFELEKCRKDIEAKRQVDREIIDGVMSRV
jgi:glycosyltransferase involved in cell wall biosynthesis